MRPSLCRGGTDRLDPRDVVHIPADRAVRGEAPYAPDVQRRHGGDPALAGEVIGENAGDKEGIVVPGAVEKRECCTSRRAGSLGSKVETCRMTPARESGDSAILLGR